MTEKKSVTFGLKVYSHISLLWDGEEDYGCLYVDGDLMDGMGIPKRDWPKAPEIIKKAIKQTNENEDYCWQSYLPEDWS